MTEGFSQIAASLINLTNKQNSKQEKQALQKSSFNKHDLIYEPLNYSKRKIKHILTKTLNQNPLCQR
jgi:hypothetical protein